MGPDLFVLLIHIVLLFDKYYICQETLQSFQLQPYWKIFRKALVWKEIGDTIS